MDLFGFILFGSLCASWTWLPVSFPKLSTFSALIPLSKFSVHLSFPSGISIMQTLICFRLSQRCFKLSSFLKIESCYIWVFSTMLSYKSLIHSSAFSNLLLIPSSMFFSFLLFYSSALISTFLDFLSLYWSSMFIHSSLKFGKNLYDHYFELFIR